MAELNKEFIVNLKGKEFVQYGGLIDLAHQMKLKSITTELIQLPNKDNGNQCIIKAVATTEDGKVFEGYGDADPNNVNSMIAKHLIRMAETRAKARALRDLTNVGMTAIEELIGDEDEQASKPAPTKKTTTKVNVSTNNNKATQGELKCTDCSKDIKQAEQVYSNQYYGKTLCFDCQKNNKKI